MTDSIPTITTGRVETRFPTLSRAWHSRLAVDAAEYSLTDAIDHCLSGEPVAASELLVEVRQHFREVVAAEHSEYEALETLPPVWKVEAALNAHRNGLLKRLTKEADGTGLFDDAGGYLIERDGDFVAYVRANDSWSAWQSGYALMVGTGLVTLLAFWRGDDLPTTVARLAQQFGLGGES